MPAVVSGVESEFAQNLINKLSEDMLFSNILVN